MHVYTLLSFSLHIGICKGTTLLETHETFLRLSKDVCENMLRDSSEEKRFLLSCGHMWGSSFAVKNVNGSVQSWIRSH